MHRQISAWVCLGVGIGLVLAGIAAAFFNQGMPDSAIIRRAESLGMVFRDEVVAYAPGDGDSREAVVICITPGMNDAQIAAVLVKAEVIARAEDFWRELNGQNGVKNIQAGVYRFAGSDDPATVVQKITRGDVIAKLE